MSVIYCLKQRACLVSAFAILVGQALFASAQTMLVDFGSDTSYRGLSVNNPDTNGNYWNSLQPGLLVENLIDIDNSATTIDVGWDTQIGTDSYNGPAGPTEESSLETDVQFTDIDAAALGNLGGANEGVFDYVTGPSFADNRVKFQIQGLDPAKTYSLTFFGSHSFSDDAETVYSIYTDDTYTTLVDSTSLEVRDPVMFWLHNRDKVATIANLSPQTDNILYVQFVGATNNANLGYLNAMQIEAIDAPGLDGDFNGDGTVDAADYVVWRRDDGSPEQFNLWRANFGMTEAGGGAGGGSAAVPEPASIMLGIVVALSLSSFKWRR